MEEKPWWPHGIVTKVVDDKIHTTWGTLSYWWDEDILSPAWWNSKKDYWGMWPKKVNKVEVIEEDYRGLIVQVDDYVARICPIPTGTHISSLGRSSAVITAIGDRVLLPIGGWESKGDRVLIFPHHDTKLQSPDGSLIYAIHKNLESHGLSAPNQENRWNERIKKFEDILQTNTLWRGPHGKSMLAAPRLGVERTGFIHHEGTLKLRPEPISLGEYLNDDGKFLPHLRDLAVIESTQTLQQWLQQENPKKSHALFRISVGGFPLLKYDVLLCQLVDALAFGLDDVHKMLKQKLTEVDRIQAKLGVMRTFRGGILLTGSVVVMGLLFSNIGLVSTTSAQVTTLLGILLMLLLRYGEQRSEPDWREF
ncbi:MAG TPA: hypothetical protein HA279_06155 [Candidatus Poseidoniaceae archaeon]|nr:hypothetical protein [Candidatus Poseidoniaceae archaeon]